MPSSRIFMENVNGKWNADCELPDPGKMGVRRRHFNAATYHELVALITAEVEASQAVEAVAGELDFPVWADCPFASLVPAGVEIRRGRLRGAANDSLVLADGNDFVVYEMTWLPERNEAVVAVMIAELAKKVAASPFARRPRMGAEEKETPDDASTPEVRRGRHRIDCACPRCEAKRIERAREANPVAA